MSEHNGHEADVLPSGDLRADEVQLLRRIMHEYKLNRKELHAVVEFVKGKERWGWVRRQFWKAFVAFVGTVGMIAALRNDIASLLGSLFQRSQ